jgi:tetratricopeptide (TPR) repeat protein
MKRVSWLMFIAVILLYPSVSLCQQLSVIDSLEQKIAAGSKKDTTYMLLLLDAGNVLYQSGNYNKATNYCRKAVQLAQELKFTRGEAEASHRLGTLLIDRGKHNEALQWLLNAVRIRQQMGDFLNAARSLNNIGAMFQDLYQYQDALKYMHQALSILNKIGVQGGVALISGNIGNIYSQLGTYDSAEYYIRQSLAIRQQSQDKQGEAYALNYLGNVYERQGKINEALIFYRNALAIEEAIQDSYLQLFSHENMGTLYFQQQQNEKARYHLGKAEQLAQQIGATKELSKIYLQYARLDSAAGNFKGSFEWYKSHKILADSIFNSERSRQIASMETEFDVAMKENAIQSLTQENQIQQQRNWLLSGLLLAAIAITGTIYLIFRNRQLQANYNLLQAEQRWRRAQMNPHFFFNALTAIQDIVADSEVTKALSYLAKFARLMRQTLEQSQQEFITLEEELALIRNYLDLQALRFRQKIAYDIQTAEEADTENLLIPVMLLQPLVENAVEHGLRHKQDVGKITVRVGIEQERLVFHISDDGIGRKEAALHRNASHRSMATDILKDRIELLKKQAKFDVQLVTADLPNGGTEVSIVMPVKYQDV